MTDRYQRCPSRMTIGDTTVQCDFATSDPHAMKDHVDKGCSAYVEGVESARPRIVHKVKISWFQGVTFNV